jgi:hypothetical protein
MGTSFDSITDEQADLIRNSPLFFVASAAPDMSDGPDGQWPINLSPKGGTPLHVISPNRVAYLDYTGSGNQTARHAEAGGSITLMVMSMGAKDAGIVRLFGHATVSSAEESPLGETLLGTPARDIELPVRQVVDVAVEGAQTSCGYGVPVFEFVWRRVRSGRGRRYKPPVWGVSCKLSGENERGVTRRRLHKFGPRCVRHCLVPQRLT